MAQREKGAGPLKKDTSSPWRAFGLFGALGMQTAVWIVAGLFAGRWLDSVLGTGPIFLVVGILSGVVLGIVGTILLIKRFLGDGL
jgi:ATP synthase protein I